MAVEASNVQFLLLCRDSVILLFPRYRVLGPPRGVVWRGWVPVIGFGGAFTSRCPRSRRIRCVPSRGVDLSRLWDCCQLTVPEKYRRFWAGRTGCRGAEGSGISLPCRRTTTTTAAGQDKTKHNITAISQLVRQGLNPSKQVVNLAISQYPRGCRFAHRLTSCRSHHDAPGPHGHIGTFLCCPCRVWPWRGLPPDNQRPKGNSALFDSALVQLVSHRVILLGLCPVGRRSLSRGRSIRMPLYIPGSNSLSLTFFIHIVFTSSHLVYTSSRLILLLPPRVSRELYPAVYSSVYTYHPPPPPPPACVLSQPPSPVHCNSPRARCSGPAP